MGDQRELSIILRVKDHATAELNKLKSGVEKLEPAFRKMAVAGTAAFAGVAASVYKTTQAAAVAEGSWNKFNTVFGDGSEEMIAFIDTLREKMPTATHEIARMAADLQDLLVPMGLTRDSSQKLTQDMLELANKVAAFNDVDPTEVLEAFKSGLSGSSEPLRRFGINALESSIEMEALSSGLLDAGQKLLDLDPVLRSQVRAQALVSLAYKQSADAISGFESNNDSLIRRQQELQASIAEISVTLGNTFLPIIDSAVKKILPLVERMSEWIQQNPDLSRNIIIATGAVAGLVAVVGALGLVLPVIIAGFTLLMGPVGLVIAIIGTLIFTVTKVVQIMQLLRDDSALVWEGIKLTFKDAIDWIVSKTLEPLMKWIDKVADALRSVRDAASNVANKAGSAIGGAYSKAKNFITGRASGGFVSGGSAYMVGEQGPEMFVPGSSGSIVPRSALAFAGGGGGVTVNVYGDVTGTELVRKVTEALESSIKRRQRLN